MAGKIFVNYRRDDSAAHALNVAQYLEREFGAPNVFLDIDRMKAGQKFPQVLEERLGASKVMLAVIGPTWLTQKNDKGERRIDDPDDWVRLEIARALQRGIPVIPVLVGGAVLPRKADLPDDLKPLVDHQVATVTTNGFRNEMAGLARDVRELLRSGRAGVGVSLAAGGVAALAAALGFAWYAGVLPTGGAMPPARIESVSTAPTATPVPAAPSVASEQLSAPDLSAARAAEEERRKADEKAAADLAAAAEKTAENEGRAREVTQGSIDSFSANQSDTVDVRLQKVPAWRLIKKEHSEWYKELVAAADKLLAEKKPGLEVATHLVQGLAALRRQFAQKALASGSERLKRIASAFLENLRSLETQSVGACYGYVAKGEMSPAVVEMMQKPENATSFNDHMLAIFEAVQDGSKTPVKHENAIKGDYDMLIGELGKLGWKEEDLKAFADPRTLAKREPSQVCKMVQDWFQAHLAIKDSAVQDRLLFETLKPVLSG